MDGPIASHDPRRLLLTGGLKVSDNIIDMDNNVPSADKVSRSPWTSPSSGGYDRFGRSAQYKYTADTTTLAELNYGYDAGSNHVYRQDASRVMGSDPFSSSQA